MYSVINFVIVVMTCFSFPVKTVHWFWFLCLIGTDKFRQR